MKKSNKFMKSLLSISLIVLFSLGARAQTPEVGYDTLKDNNGHFAQVGVLYLSDTASFATKTGYAYRVIKYNWKYEPDKKAKPGDSVVAMIRTKEPTSRDYYIDGVIGGKKTWIKTQCLLDFDMDLRKPH